MTSEDKALSLIHPIREAHEKATSAQQSGYQASLQAAIDCGELLEKAKEAVGTGNWSKWRDKHLPDLPQTTASLYVRLAKNKDRFKERALATGVANLGAEGKLSIRSAAALLAKQRPRGKPPTKTVKGDEDIGKEWLKGLAADEVIEWLKQLHGGTEWLRVELSAALAKALRPPTQSIEGLRRPLTSQAIPTP